MPLYCNCTVASTASISLASFRDGLIERGLEPLIGFDQLRVLIRRGDKLV